MSLSTLDILLFDGNEVWFSTFIEWLTWSKFSHVGIALSNPTYIKSDLIGQYMFESGEEPVKDSVEDRLIFGVQITDFDKLKEDYVGKIYKRTITTTLSKETIEIGLVEVYDLVYGHKYDENILDFLRDELDMKLGSECRKTNEFFCSAFAGYLMVKLGMIDKDTRWDLLTPKDFSPGYKVDKLLKEKGNSSYSKLINIK